MLTAPLHDGISDRTLTQLDLHRVLARLAELTRTSVGAELAAIPRLWRDRETVHRYLSLTTEVRALLDQGETIPLGGITDVRGAADLASRGGVLDAADLVRTAGTLRSYWLLRTYFAARRDLAPGLAALSSTLPDLSALSEYVLDAFDDRGELKDDASPELADLRTRRHHLHTRIRARIHAMLNERGVAEHLQDSWYTIREDRYVLPVRSGDKAEVGGIIHASSHTGRTLFIEPSELVPQNNELKLLEHAVRVEEQRIYALLSSEVGKEAPAIVLGLTLCAELDVAAARGRLSEEMKASAPELTEDDRVHLVGARNPVLVLRGAPVVPNDVDLRGQTRILVITGPNAGGKTVTLSTLGLVAIMTRAGLHTPVGPDSRIPVFHDVVAVLGDAQDLGHDLSTFSGHLQRLNAALDQLRTATGGARLILLDELAAGTEPEQGAALGTALLEAFADVGAVGAVTTHFDRLKTISLADPRFSNAAVGFDRKGRQPTYRLTLGNPGSSSALEIARRAGLDPAIVDRAEAMLGDQTRSLEAVLTRLEAEREALAAEREVVRIEKRKVEHDQENVRRKLERIEQQGEALVREARRTALEEVAKAKDTIGNIVRELQRERDPRVVERRRVKIAETERSLEAGLSPEDRPIKAARRRPVTPEEAIVGLPVWLPNLDRDGVIEALRGQNAIVAAADLRLTVRIVDLWHAKAKPPAPEPAPTTTGPGRASAAPNTRGDARARPPEPEALLNDGPPMRVPSNTCDVRGMRADEALDMIERFLDNNTLANAPAVYVLHGHGTGKLKSAIRAAFRTSRYVKAFRAADTEQGGDAVTLVWLV